MKSRTKKWAMLSLCAAACLSCAFAVASLAPNTTVIAEDATTNQTTNDVTANTGEEVPPVAKIGDTEYTTIDEALSAWTNNTTLTLLSDVTLSDVVALSSQEHHYLELGTYILFLKRL